MKIIYKSVISIKKSCF